PSEAKNQVQTGPETTRVRSITRIPSNDFKRSSPPSLLSLSGPPSVGGAAAKKWVVVGGGAGSGPGRTVGQAASGDRTRHHNPIKTARRPAGG
ncbi:MAG: hypothetical protein OXF99_06245, partial [bacterium]|nr:hypothetical protein [bacterium]